MVGRFPGSTPAGVSTSAGRLGWRPVWIVVSRKKKTNRRLTARRLKRERQADADAVRFRAAPLPLAFLCTDPECLEGIHHLDGGAEEPAPEQRTTRGAHPGPFSDPSDLDSEAAGGQHSTPEF